MSSRKKQSNIGRLKDIPLSDLKHTYLDFSGKDLPGSALGDVDDSEYMIPNTSNTGNEDESGYLVPDVLKSKGDRKHILETSSETSDIIGDKNLCKTGERRFVSCAHKEVDIAHTDSKYAPASTELQHAYFTVGDKPSDYSKQHISSTAASRSKEAENENTPVFHRNFLEDGSRC